jgi:hypothetical protein
MDNRIGLILHSEYYGIIKVARKSYKCYLCGAEIKKGEKYIWRKPFWSDKPFQVCIKHAGNVGLLKELRDHDD